MTDLANHVATYRLLHGLGIVNDDILAGVEIGAEYKLRRTFGLEFWDQKALNEHRIMTVCMTGGHHNGSEDARYTWHVLKVEDKYALIGSFYSILPTDLSTLVKEWRNYIRSQLEKSFFTAHIEAAKGKSADDAVFAITQHLAALAESVKGITTTARSNPGAGSFPVFRVITKTE